MRHCVLSVTIGLFLGLFLIPATPLRAEIFKWTDDQGKVHFTNDKSSIPRKFRDAGDLKQLRGSGATPDSGDSPASARKPGKDAEILTEAELAKIETAKAFLRKEQRFVQDEDTAYHTPTAMREFGNKYSMLNQEREQAKKSIDGTNVPALRNVVSHIEATLKSAEENPNWMRKLSAANTVKRLKTEVAGNGALIASLDAAVEKSKEKEKEKEKEEAEKAEKDKKKDGKNKKPAKK